MDKTKPGLIFSHSTSTEDTSFSKTSSSEGVTFLDDLSSSLLQSKFNSDTFSVDKNDLKGKPQGQINWLGSSYTGQDIKVIAHLYDNKSLNTERKVLENELVYWQTIQNGAIGLVAQFSTLINVATWKDFQKSVDNAIWALIPDRNHPEQNRAANYLQSILLGAGFPGLKGLTAAYDEFASLKFSSSHRIGQINDSIKRLNDKNNEASDTLVLGTLQTLSISIHREREAVRALGKSYAINYTNGQRTIAGSMIFTLFEEHPVAKLTRAIAAKQASGKDHMSTLLPDQLPPIDISIIFANEYGSVSRQTIYGLQFVNDGATYSIENLLTEQVMNFVCRDVDIMTSVGNVPLLRLGRPSEIDFSGTNLLGSSKEYQDYLNRLGLRNRFRNR